MKVYRRGATQLGTRGIWFIVPAIFDGIIPCNGLTGIVTVKTVVCRSFEYTGDDD